MTGERDPRARHDEIDTFLDWLGTYWHNHPYLRLGQMVHHASAATNVAPGLIEDPMIPYGLGRIDAQVELERHERMVREQLELSSTDWEAWAAEREATDE